MELTKSQVVKILSEDGGIVAESIDMEQKLFYNRYLNQIGKEFLLGKYVGILQDAQYFPSFDKQEKGLLTFKLPYKLEIKRVK
jgi:hypothetical protein